MQANTHASNTHVAALIARMRYCTVKPSEYLLKQEREIFVLRTPERA